MRIVFCGASELGYRCCEALLEQGFDVVGIFTTPRQFNISYSPDKPVTNVLFRDFHELGQRNKIPVVDIEGKMGGHCEAFRQLRPDVIVVIGWYYMVPKVIRDIPPLGCIGIHASLLPKYRGGAPLVWAMINGEAEAGLSLFFLEDGVDTGDLLAQRRFPIEPRDTIRDMLAKVEAASLEILPENLRALEQGTNQRIKQDESEATYVPQRKPEDGEIDWSWEAPRIRNFIRALTKPYPGAFTRMGNKKVIIWDADISED